MVHLFLTYAGVNAVESRCVEALHKKQGSLVTTRTSLIKVNQIPLTCFKER